MKLGISPLAEKDLELIGDWIAKDNPIRALSFIEELYQNVFLLQSPRPSMRNAQKFYQV